MKIQYIPSKFYSNLHKISISVIGAGGTGSLLLQQLGRINSTLVGLDQKGLFVRCFDDDVVTEANLGRQLFTENDLGLSKSDVLISNINMFYGTQWLSFKEKVTKETKNVASNIIFICVDNVKARKDIYSNLKNSRYLSRYHETMPYYIIDCGNELNSGQVYLSTVGTIRQPESRKYTLVEEIINPFEKYGEKIFNEDKNDGPSCSIAQAIGKQDLMINQFVSNAAAKMLWDILRNKFISYNEIYIQLEGGIKIQTNKL